MSVQCYDGSGQFLLLICSVGSLISVLRAMLPLSREIFVSVIVNYHRLSVIFKNFRPVEYQQFKGNTRQLATSYVYHITPHEGVN